MDNQQNNNAIDVKSLQHSEDLLKVEDIIVEECEAKNMIGFRFTDCPTNQNTITPQAYKYLDKYNPTKEELDQEDEDLRKKYATLRGLSMYTNETKAEQNANRVYRKLMEKDEEEAESFIEENGYLVKFIIPASVGVSTRPHRTTKHFNFFPNQDVDVLALMDQTYGYKKIDYKNDTDK